MAGTVLKRLGPVDADKLVARLKDEQSRAQRVLEADRGIDPDEDNWHIGRIQGLMDAQRIVVALCGS